MRVTGGASGGRNARVRLAVRVGDDVEPRPDHAVQNFAAIAQRLFQLRVRQRRECVVSQGVEAHSEPGCDEGLHVSRSQSFFGNARRPDSRSQCSGDLVSLCPIESLDRRGHAEDRFWRSLEGRP